MTTENKTLLFIIVLSTLFIGSTLSVIVLLVFGDRAAFFFVIVFAIPIGVVCSLLVLMLYKAIKSNKS